MPAIPQKIRMGLVELRTDVGSVYVHPSFWERVYLLWTFRNFPILPKQVLSRREQQLIDKLCRTEIASRTTRVAGTLVIGTVENVYLKQSCEIKTSAAAGTLVEMSAASATSAVSQAVGSERISVRVSRAAYNRTRFGRLRNRNVQNISAPKQESVEQSEGKQPSPAPVLREAGSSWSRSRVGWALVATCGAGVLGILLYFREGPLKSPIGVSHLAREAPTPASGSVLATVLRPESIERTMPTVRGTPTVVPQPPSSTVSSRQRERGPHKTIVSKLPVATVESTATERLQVEESPQGGVSYPVAPTPNLTGKVRLKAVIGIDGKVREVDVLSGNRELAAAASRAVRHWRYGRHELEGRAVEAETNITISFVGDDAVSVSFPAVR
jgi:outer membrane biosynthesis protein TonB